jgi:Lrp/AsnC family transcriptional regulator for asnA, asnC and gidA
MDLDDTDRAILRELQADARTPFSEIARRIDMSSATVHDRVTRMEDEGVIEGYHADIDTGALGLGVEAYVGLRIQQGATETVLERLEGVAAVQEVVLVTGEWDALMHVVVDDTDALRRLIFERVGDIEGVERSHTMVVLGKDDGDAALPVE